MIYETMNFINKNNVNLLQFNSLLHKNLFHFSTTIQGGISTGEYSTFNLGFYAGDNRENVYENRTRLASLAEAGYQSLFVPYQTHSDKICVIDEEFLSLKDDDRYLKLNGVDALITNQSNICIGVTTADCVPVLIFDPVKKVLAAVHAGWKRTVQYIAALTVKEMIRKFGCKPQDIFAGIAPSICAECYEVGNDVRDTFMLAAFDMEKISYRNDNTGKYHIDLREANRLQLIEVDVLPEHIEVSDLCTYSNPGMFFSARRQTIHCGRMVTGGVIQGF